MAARQRRGMDGISALPEHLQHDVFSRVGDIKALFRFAATCRRWLHRFTDPAYLRELWHGSSCGWGHHHRAHLLGVLVRDQYYPLHASSSACLAPVFSPALGSPLGSAAGGGALTSDDGTFDYAQLLAARRGIVLLQLAPSTRTLVEEEDRCHLFAICNPLTGDRHVLPPLVAGCRSSRVVGYAIITATDHPPAAAAARLTFSQLLVITQDGDRRRQGADARMQKMHSYSAATRRWSAPTTCLDRSVFTLVGAESGVVHGGAAHWLCVDDGRARAARDDGDDRHLYRLSVEVVTTTRRVSLTRLPVRVGGKQLLCVNSDGNLVVASVYPAHVTIWTQPGRGGAGAGDDDDTTPAVALWPRTSFRITPHYRNLQWCCNFNHGSLLAIFMGGSSVFILDLDTKMMEEVSILDFDKAMGILRAKWYLTCVPYEMDLVEFFTLQLGNNIIQERLASSETESP